MYNIRLLFDSIAIIYNVYYYRADIINTDTNGKIQYGITEHDISMIIYITSYRIAKFTVKCMINY